MQYKENVRKGTKERRYKIVIAFALATMFVHMLWSSLIWRELETFEDDLRLMKYILLWNSKEYLRHIAIGQHAFIDRKCPVNNCYVTSNRSLLNKRTTDFDAILFYYPEIFKEKKLYRKRVIYHNLPKERSPKQIYIFVSEESNVYYPLPGNKIYDNYFNMTWTYKLDSDLYFGYLAIRNYKGEVIGPSDNIRWLKVKEMLPINETLKNKLNKKHKVGAWFVSNCKSRSNREVLMDELNIELDQFNASIDVYGECGTKNCPKNKMEECRKLIANYYFYFALENSFSIDYVTEKLLNALKNYAVPVVYGAADYKRFMPDGMYLDASKLSKKELAEKIFRSIIDKDVYYDYFRWYNHYSFEDVDNNPDTDPICKLCEYINYWEGTKVVANLTDWWNEKNRWENLRYLTVQQLAQYK